MIGLAMSLTFSLLSWSIRVSVWLCLLMFRLVWWFAKLSWLLIAATVAGTIALTRRSSRSRARRR